MKDSTMYRWHLQLYPFVGPDFGRQPDCREKGQFTYLRNKQFQRKT